MGGTFDRDLRRLLSDAGWRYLRPAKGSHELWGHPDHPKPVVVPQGMVSRHTANGVLRQAGLPEAF